MAAPALRLELNLLGRVPDKFDDFPEHLALAQRPDLRGLRGSQRTGQEAMDKGAKVGVVATPTPVEPFARRTRRCAYLHITLVITHPDGFAV